MDFIILTPEKNLPPGHLEDMRIKLDEWFHLTFYPTKFSTRIFSDRKIESDDLIVPINIGKFYNSLLTFFATMTISNIEREKQSLLLLIMKHLNAYSPNDFSQVYEALTKKLTLDLSKDWDIPEEKNGSFNRE